MTELNREIIRPPQGPYKSSVEYLLALLKCNGVGDQAVTFLQRLNAHHDLLALPKNSQPKAEPQVNVAYAGLTCTGREVEITHRARIVRASSKGGVGVDNLDVYEAYLLSEICRDKVDSDKPRMEVSIPLISSESSYTLRHPNAQMWPENSPPLSFADQLQVQRRYGAYADKFEPEFVGRQATVHQILLDTFGLPATQ